MQEEKVDDKFAEDSKNRLLSITSKKIRTVMIGGLDLIEKFILKSPQFKELSKELEIVFEDSIRPKLLDLGNRQIRNIEQEFLNHTIIWNRYEIKFEVKEKSA